MSCNKDSNCLNIARTVYPKLNSEIDGSISSISNQVNEVVGELNGLVIPEDYLGNRVKEKLSEICAGFESDSSDLVTIKSSVDSFISNKISEHEKHYRDWKYAQEQLKKKKEENKEEDK